MHRVSQRFVDKLTASLDEQGLRDAMASIASGSMANSRKSLRSPRSRMERILPFRETRPSLACDGDLPCPVGGGAKGAPSSKWMATSSAVHRRESGLAVGPTMG